MNKKQKKTLIRIVTGACITAALSFAETDGFLLFALYLVPYLIVGYDILYKAFKGILNRQVFDENFLMAIATVGAMVIGLTKTGDYLEAVGVMLLYQTGELFQSCAVGKSRRSIQELMDIRPDYANIEINGSLQQLDPEDIAVGTVITVQPGERIPIDGVVVSGHSALNTAALTGESLQRSADVGDEVISGCINLTGVLKIRTTREFGESTVSRILELVEDAGSRKSRSERFISRFARVYTPAVCCSALALALLPPLVRLAMALSPDWLEWLYRALTFLVISCPCALVISIPLSFFAGIGGAGSRGILIKGSNYLEALSNVDCVVFDKTGTLTLGSFEVSEIISPKMEPQELLEYAALAESSSSHPISKSLQRAYGKNIDRSLVADICEISGRGVTALAKNRSVALGNEKLMEYLGIVCDPCPSAGTVIHIAIDGEYSGSIVISDTVKPGAADAMAALKRAGVKKTVMLTGDRHSAAESVAAELGIDEVHSELLPADKVEKLEALLEKMPKNRKLAFVGDGINDAPVLSRADIGIAMGALGSDAAIEAADVVLMDDDPMKIAKAVKISRKCLGIVRQNIVFAFGIKAVCLILGAAGYANMWLAIFADVGVMVLAVGNAVRALFVKKL